MLSIDVFSLGISIPDGPDFFVYEPGLEISQGYTVRNSMDFPVEAYAAAEGTLAEYVSFDREKIKLAPLQSGSFNVMINFPEDISLEPGIYSTRILVTESRGEGDIGARASVGDTIKVRVEYDGKYIDSRLSAQNANAGENVKFSLTLNNYGTEDIVKLNSEIEIYNPEGERIEVVDVPSIIDLRRRDSKTIYGYMDSQDYKPGDYSAKALLEYDGVEGESNFDEFKIGELVIDIINHTDKVGIDNIEEFLICAQSGWNNKIDEVYATVAVNGKNRFKTFNEDFKPWEAKCLQGYIDTNGLSEGLHPIDIALHYEGKETTKSGEIMVSNMPIKEEPVSKFESILALGIIVGALTILNLFWFAYARNEKKKK